MGQAGSGRRWVAVVVAFGLLLGAACGDDDGDQASTGEVVAIDAERGTPGVDAPEPAVPEVTADGPEIDQDGNIVGGVDVADIATYPWVVAVYRSNPSDNYCGGTIIAPRRVLTAAHCVTDDLAPGDYTIASPGEYAVVEGRTQLSDTSVGHAVAVQQIWVHARYDNRGEKYRFDFALLDLAEDMEALPIALPKPSQRDLWAVGKLIYPLGWGCEVDPRLEGACEREGTSPLQIALMQVQARSVCLNLLPGQGAIHHSSQCAKSPVGAAASCNADSGGPWVSFGRDNKPYLVGVTSYGPIGCGANLPEAPAFVPKIVDESLNITGRWNTCDPVSTSCDVVRR